MASSPTRPNRQGSRLCALIAVIALYGFALQAVLGGMRPAPASAEGLCAGYAQTEGRPDRAHPHDQGACCTAAQAAGLAPPPRMGSASVAWPAQAAGRVAWTSRPALLARAPPGRIAPPRGPPAA